MQQPNLQNIVRQS